ncbi:hypothetical protein CAL7102_08277 [Dulcicalothrix desertica PCC 7102]|nr:hypothetical protein CAL7102_08277 [Dulcicalothrix desertica PCC 7102]
MANNKFYHLEKNSVLLLVVYVISFGRLWGGQCPPYDIRQPGKTNNTDQSVLHVIKFGNWRLSYYKVL